MPQQSFSASPRKASPHKLAARKLVGIKVGREWRLPTWQFDPDVAYRRAYPIWTLCKPCFPVGR